MSSDAENAKHVKGEPDAKDLVTTLFAAVADLAGALTKGIVNTPITPGPVVDIKHGKPRRP
ncbi:hypothetical protein Skr01_01370 [Sphaerisporangium krabiense]|uniref:Uncharacterized protein n=1 Tax=Sphaerisporangium krabiense TaxID=763782 RepID=A0A7W9DS34_9ACTN|nr:hypothetical protein [Sphaerisporangium krabiense]MBB5629108.1 hypothetical protein [Sphaerisporangium krabiense]GII60052.1 hypothetical protein Skr01_01370 [Sphaerisporangium krabiense]